MGTFCHILRPNKARQFPTRFVFYDCETFEEKMSQFRVKHRLKLGVACEIHRFRGGEQYEEEWTTFKTVPGFWDFVFSRLRSRSKVFLVAHNQHFDFPVVNGFYYLTSRGWEMKRPILDHNLFIVSFVKGTKKILVVDTANWFKMSLKTIGDSLGIPKYEVDFKTCTDEELERYCRQDVHIIKEAVLSWIRFLREHNLGNFQQTAASQAFSAYRHRFMQHEIYVHDLDHVQNLERSAYHGGRTEAYRLGEVDGLIYELDFNSLYPSVMRDNPYPSRLVKYEQNVPVSRLQDLLQGFLVIARVRVRLDKPLVPVRGSRLLFPVGEFDAVLCTPEIKRVLKDGLVLKVYEAAIYQGAPLFKRYVDELYALRQQYKRDGNKLYDLLIKLVLNSLYGKFGQRNEKIEEIGWCDPELVEYERIIKYGTLEKYVKWSFGGKTFLKGGELMEWRHSCPQISAHATAYARLKLLEAIEQAGWENVYYCDTDSLFVNIRGYKRLRDELDDTVLGKLKLVRVGSQLKIYGLKDYEFAGYKKRKGVKKDAKQLSTNVFEQEKWLKFRSLLREDSLDAPIVDMIPRELCREYKKGRVLSDGSVRPYRLPDDHSLAF